MMTNREIATEYLRRFCAGDIAGLAYLLAHDVRFTGPFHTFYSSTDYLDSLRHDPPEQCGHKILSITENEDAVAVFYEYQKPDKPITIAQLFKIKNEKITETLLIFDGRSLAEQ